MAILNQEKIAMMETLAKEHFWFFCQMLMPVKWYDAVFHRKLCDFLQHGGGKKMVILARTHLKTTICAQFFPLWRAVNRPSIRCLEVSNTSPNAEKTVHSIRAVIENNSLFQAIFPDIIPNFSKVRWSDRCATVNRPEDFPEGTFESAGVGANIIRRHFNIILEDDTVAPKKDDMTGEESMPSREDIDQAIGFHRLTPPLFIGEDYDEHIVIGTRWADYDHLNWIQNNEPGYKIFDVPAEDADGKPTYKRFNRERLDSIRMSMGEYMYNALYLNKPLSKDSMTFSPDWITYFEEHEVPEEGNTVVTVDPADPPTGKSSQCYSAIVCCKHTKVGIYVLEYKRDRMTDKQLISASLDMAGRREAGKIRIEVDRYAHLQYGIREQMERDGVYFMIDAVKTRGKNKVGRIRQRLQPLYENRVIKHRHGMRELETELFQFPNGVFVDLIDALAWQIEGIYPTERIVVEAKKKRTLPTVEEMYESLAKKRNGGRNYPFDNQLGLAHSSLFLAPTKR